MRNSFVKELEKLAKKHENILLLTADLGFGVLDNFQKDFSSRFINAGICEQNMTAMAAGLALEGSIVYTYSIGNFPTMRCLEQVRNDVCYHNANVKIVAVGCGFAYGQLGMTHHTTEDIAIIRALPNINIYSPADPHEAVSIIKVINNLEKPCYIRLGKGNEPLLHPKNVSYDISKLVEIYKGKDIAVIFTGAIGVEAIRAYEFLKNLGHYIGIYNAITLKPFDEEGVKELSLSYKVIITLEEHNIIGGLGSIIADAISTNNLSIKLIKMGLNDEYTSIVGSQEYLRKYYKMSKDFIVKKILENL
ncbi:MAG: transketolase family protein [Treponemataceae bacterium]